MPLLFHLHQRLRHYCEFSLLFLCRFLQVEGFCILLHFDTVVLGQVMAYGKTVGILQHRGRFTGMQHGIHAVQFRLYVLSQILLYLGHFIVCLGPEQEGCPTRHLPQHVHALGTVSL